VFLRAHLLVFAMLLAASPLLSAQSAPLDKQRMTQVVEDYVDNGSFMGDVLVAEGDRVVLKAAYGYADLDWSVENTTDAKFRIGSLTKQFTAASILLLQEQGKVTLSDSIKNYLPEVPDAWKNVTVANLLNQTSGIPNFTGTPGFDAYKRQDHTSEESVGLVRGKPLDFEPGTKFYYSNTNYILLGEIIEHVAGMSYGDFLRRNIFQPVGMTDTGLDNDSLILPKRAHGYDRAPDGFRYASTISMTIPFSAGSLFSTVGDLFKWERALFAGKIISAASLRSMTSPKLGEYGMGLFVRTAGGHQIVTHDGTIEGFESVLSYYPERQLTIVVLSNVRTDAPERIAAQLAKVAFGEKVVLNSDRHIVEVGPSVLRKYVGHYSAPPFAITLSVEAGHLIATTPAGRKYVLYAQSPTFFFLKEIDVQLDFTSDPISGNTTGFAMTQDGHVRQVKRDDP
jgi:CubicO group peptidase (beta-lactamase class C family)